jgi:hypothetical protein
MPGLAHLLPRISGPAPLTLFVMSKPFINYSKRLRQELASGKTLDQALSKLRVEGVMMGECIASVRTLNRCSLEDAKRLVESSSAWADIRRRTEDEFRSISQEPHRS